MISRVGRHYQPTLWDAFEACACPRKLTLLASSFGVKFPQPQSRSPILIWAYARKFHLSHAIWQLYLPYTNFSWYNLLEFFKPLFHLQLDVVHFMTLCPH